VGAGNLTTLLDAVEDALPLDVIGVVGLDIGSKTVEGALDSLLGRRVHHAGLQAQSNQPSFIAHQLNPFLLSPAREGNTHILRRIIRAPANKRDLATRPFAALQLIAHIKHGIPAADALLALAILGFGVDQLVAERAPVALVGLLFDDNLFPVVADLVDDVFDVLAQLELVEGRDAVRVYGDTRNLVSTLRLFVPLHDGGRKWKVVGGGGCGSGYSGPEERWYGGRCLFRYVPGLSLSTYSLAYPFVQIRSGLP
jgi:hypothetical protein